MNINKKTMQNYIMALYSQILLKFNYIWPLCIHQFFSVYALNFFSSVSTNLHYY